MGNAVVGSTEATVALKAENLADAASLDRERSLAAEAAAEAAAASFSPLAGVVGATASAVSSSPSSSSAVARLERVKVNMVRLRFRRSPFGCEDHNVRCGSGRPLAHVKELLAKQVSAHAAQLAPYLHARALEGGLVRAY